ncbi:hypothetical protein B0A48_15468 [Cryoendolithus antarcticus]|uniref:Uncharacterized protein n=1 Tax=Cryoendolithus antarcticus TaxID=1507870 RepID=A0A1V8SGA7_9PEZI|nr:hypothetical protein B0A48_15468 [Cryoendolithus antarcticus]
MLMGELETLLRNLVQDARVTHMAKKLELAGLLRYMNGRARDFGRSNSKLVNRYRASMRRIQNKAIDGGQDSYVHKAVISVYDAVGGLKHGNGVSPPLTFRANSRPGRRPDWAAYRIDELRKGITDACWDEAVLEMSDDIQEAVRAVGIGILSHAQGVFQDLLDRFNATVDRTADLPAEEKQLQMTLVGNLDKASKEHA